MLSTANQTPLFIYITRPYAYEIYMGGKRDLCLWWERPSYSHRSTEYDAFRKVEYVDAGWHSNRCMYGSLCSKFLSQDTALLEAVWKEVFISILPKGMTYEEGLIWQDEPQLNGYGQPDNKYHILFDDKEWEAKCNTCFKRFLLKVDLKTYSVERIKPFVDERDTENNTTYKKGWVETDEILPFFATERFHIDRGQDFIPF